MTRSFRNRADPASPASARATARLRRGEKNEKMTDSSRIFLQQETRRGHLESAVISVIRLRLSYAGQVSD